MWLPGTGLLAIVAGTALLTAACGSGSAPPSQVASLGTSGGQASSSNGSGTPTAAPSAGNPTRLLDEWAACMRSHGVPGQADPIITASRQIDVNWNPAIPGGIFGHDGKGSGPGRFCVAYLNAAQNALQGGQPPKQPSQATMVKYAGCMRANGVPDFPDFPTGGGAVNVGALDPNSPAFQNAEKVCYQKTGVPGLTGGGPPQPGSIVFGGNGG